MEASSMEEKNLPVFELGSCESGYLLGFLVGQRFTKQIRSRLATDLIFQNQLLPFAKTQQSQPLLRSLSNANREKFPSYWDELLGTAEGSGVAVLDLMLLNFRKEILPFVPKTTVSLEVDHAEDCSDVLAFTLNSVPPSEDEIVAGGIGRNFISRDLLEATNMDDALTRIRSSGASVGHSYNLIDIRARRILNVETASRNRISVRQVQETPFFHANMYLHLQSQQVQDENSLSRQKRAALQPKQTRTDFLSLLGDTDEESYPIYMKGPTLYTLCTALIDLDEKTLSIIEGNPKEQQVTHIFLMSSRINAD
ncbi:hypothetical protein RHGRI_032563 [Rhododendron griersonianum]|uniref:Peptidase C45 hydrolase domain-containing protein n=1 Tax=Rhododendron griersonianum TaxID=479676 RepID=A0AAV6ICF3_9ERIC|nr:hypothetical protein RHGRI_032563 [Rhododendron griersonianum]